MVIDMDLESTEIGSQEGALPTDRQVKLDRNMACFPTRGARGHLALLNSLLEADYRIRMM